ncbi:MAG: hypothetical protein HKN63_07955 [Rhodobacteraceae bacterium]|nr:hypothetical protein [Paracoccaceae bacterium]
MSRPNPAFLAVFLSYVVISTAAAALLKGGLYLGQHEGDTLHLIDIINRLASGERIHQDFMTPLGILAFWPIEVFVGLGFGYGMAMHFAQALVAAVLLPAIWWVSYSRMTRLWAYTFGGITLVMVTALVHGTGELTTSMSMHYNRWAWALTFIAIPLALLPPKGTVRPMLDGVLIGLALAGMALIKATYFLSFMPVIAIVLLAKRGFATLLAAVLAGLVVAIGTVLVGGMGYVEGYIQDLIAVSQSTIRGDPGLPVAALIVSPNYLGGTLLAIAGLIFLRQSGASVAGLAVILLLPGFIFVTYQNFGNDRVWLFLLAVVLLMLRPDPGVLNSRGWDLRTALTLTAVAGLAIIFPSLTNLTTSSLRHLGTPNNGKVALLDGPAKRPDVFVPVMRGEDILVRTSAALGQTDGEAIDPKFGSFVPVAFGEDRYAPCLLLSGTRTWFSTIAEDMQAHGLTDGRLVFTADTLSPLPLYSDVPILPGGAPWYYGGLSGFENADIMVVPRCALDLDVRNGVLKDLADRAGQMTKLRDTQHYVAYLIGR